MFRIIGDESFSHQLHQAEQKGRDSGTAMGYRIGYTMGIIEGKNIVYNYKLSHPATDIATLYSKLQQEIDNILRYKSI